MNPNETVLSGALLLALPVAVLGGLVSFFSPCVLPLVPGYLSYVTGVGGADLKEARRGRMFLGAVLFVLGFTIVFVSGGALFGSFGANLINHRETVNKVFGVLIVVFGLIFLGFMPRLTQREFRLHHRPVVGLAGAPVLGFVFGVGWVPCIGPTLAAVQALAFSEATAGRGALLMVAYCVGLGLPFIAAALAFRRALGAFGWVKRHYAWVMRLGGAMLITTGVLLFTGTWDRIVYEMQVWAADFQIWI
ncbi:cytochrome c biogenesis CcdA family protein [Streptomyces hainanensis]|uniref:Cytochrome c biogenesis protein CcdA n=1 Tax=Streptomyces hainanensis TaxID=402648 RepID=A0A4R4TGX1_9ACTN|nr:cytochrome c biogenesis protein CcdA [Streptomyces hainanensis]TDC76891.1 cytochrome c biogenesis protein CcdA [Streptomyces hainanensis]